MKASPSVMAIPAITVRLQLRHTLRQAIIKSFPIIYLLAIDANFFPDGV
jgi:hypothetical protein